MGHKIEAVVFDVDGTLVDSPATILDAYKFLSENHDLPLHSRDEVRKHMGQPVQDICSVLFPEHPDPNLLARVAIDYVSENSHTHGMYPNAKRLLKTLHNNGIKIAAFTNSDHGVYDVLQQFEIDGFFTSVVHSGRVSQPKPFGEGVELALRECDVDPDRAVMVGDMYHDVASGKAGGVAATIGVSYGFGTLEQLREAGADYIIDDLWAVGAIIAMIE